MADWYKPDRRGVIIVEATIDPKDVVAANMHQAEKCLFEIVATKATIKSSIGGNCRIRSYNSLKGKGLKEAKGENPNAIFTVAEIQAPLNHAENQISAPSLKKIYEYDVVLQKGDVIEIKRL